MNAITEARSSTQPVNTRTGGSTFKNPPGRKAWELVDAAGCRGLRMGDAQVSEMHCNFLINHGSASAADIEGLGEEVRRRVRVGRIDARERFEPVRPDHLHRLEADDEAAARLRRPAHVPDRQARQRRSA